MSREGAADTKYRMSAYYYSFRPTGVPEIDNILNAIAWAGKAFHHTEHWTEEISPYPECEGESCCDWIQNAADKAAKALDAAYAAGLREGLKDALEIVQEEAEGDIDLADFLIAKRLAHQCSNPQHWDEPHPCKLCAGERLAQQAEGGADGTHEHE